MKILVARKVTSTYHLVETDDKDWPNFRRWNADCWEQLMGESWESCYDDELEKAFQKQQHEPVG